MRSWPAFEHAIPLTRRILTGSDGFFEVLARRRSALGGSVSEHELSSVLWHAMLLRERSRNSRFGEWESRAAPSAGGLHSLGIACLPVDGSSWCGLYDPEAHELRSSSSFESAISLNRNEIDEILSSKHGITLQFIGDRRRYEACYQHWESLFWRDAGALLGIITMIATALGLEASPVGRNGNHVVAAAGFPPPRKSGGRCNPYLLYKDNQPDWRGGTRMRWRTLFAVSDLASGWPSKSYTTLWRPRLPMIWHSPILSA